MPKTSTKVIRKITAKNTVKKLVKGLALPVRPNARFVQLKSLLESRKLPLGKVIDITKFLKKSKSGKADRGIGTTTRKGLKSLGFNVECISTCSTNKNLWVKVQISKVRK